MISKRLGSGRYVVRRGEDVFVIERMGANSPNKGLWETRDAEDQLIGVDANKRGAMRLIEIECY